MRMDGTRRGDISGPAHQRRWYVALWDSRQAAPYTTIVTAPIRAVALYVAHQEKAAEDWDSQTAEDLGVTGFDQWAAQFDDEWHVVDCLDLDAFIRRYAGDKLVAELHREHEEKKANADQ